MTRSINTASNRQRIFTMLDDMLNKTREERGEAIRKKFPDTTAKTAVHLIQQHHAAKKKDGTLTTLYVVYDHKQNKPCEPYIGTTYVYKPTGGDITPEMAVSTFKAKNQTNNLLATALLEDW